MSACCSSPPRVGRELRLFCSECLLRTKTHLSNLHRTDWQAPRTQNIAESLATRRLSTTIFTHQVTPHKAATCEAIPRFIRRTFPCQRELDLLSPHTHGYAHGARFPTNIPRTECTGDRCVQVSCVVILYPSTKVPRKTGGVTVPSVAASHPPKSAVYRIRTLQAFLFTRPPSLA